MRHQPLVPLEGDVSVKRRTIADCCCNCCCLCFDFDPRCVTERVRIARLRQHWNGTDLCNPGGDWVFVFVSEESWVRSWSRDVFVFIVRVCALRCRKFVFGSDLEWTHTAIWVLCSFVKGFCSSSSCGVSREVGSRPNVETHIVQEFVFGGVGFGHGNVYSF